MRIADMSMMGWFHTVFCLVALVAGARNLAGAKGTAIHRIAGKAYVVSMVLLNVSALFVYEPGHRAFATPSQRALLRPVDLGHFGPFHWLALVTLAIVIVGYLAGSRQTRAPFAYVHPISMVVSYYLLIGGAVNEIYARISALTAVAARTNGAAVGFTHALVMFLSFGVLTYFIGKVVAYRQSERAIENSAATSVAAG
jgi:uncharacterized membrane protein